MAALHTHHAVCRLVALLHLHALMRRGATRRQLPDTCPAAPADVEAREWDVAEHEEVELQVGVVIGMGVGVG